MKKVISFLIILALLIIAFPINSYASSASVSNNSGGYAQIGDTVTVTVSYSTDVYGIQYNLNYSSDILTFLGSSGNANDVGGAISVVEYSSNNTTPISRTTFTFRVEGEGTASFSTYGILAADANDEPLSISSSRSSFIVKQPEPEPAPAPEPEPEPEPAPEQAEESEPNFSSTNKTMYTTQQANLRSTWSTSSNGISVPEGTELTVTGTSTNRVNGYVWYRVSYKGETRYIASNLLTSNTQGEETQPEVQNVEQTNTIIEKENKEVETSTNVIEKTDTSKTEKEKLVLNIETVIKLYAIIITLIAAIEAVILIGNYKKLKGNNTKH